MILFLKFLALIHNSALFDVVSVTVISIILGGNWSRPSGNTGLEYLDSFMSEPYVTVLPDGLDQCLF